MRVITTERVPIKMWLEYLEDGAEVQAKNLANLPFAYKHIAIMPDAHQGYGMPIGGVLATEGVVIPNAVGVDIGCGMSAVKTSLDSVTLDRVKEIIGRIRSDIPVGFSHNKDKVGEERMPEGDWEKYPVLKREYDKARYQMGSLGGGNHFIELQLGNDGIVWVMVHSGSRNFGLQVAKYYNDLAKKLNAKWAVGIPPSWDLAFLPIDTDEGRNYLFEMNYCVEFAKANRDLMMTRITGILGEITGCEIVTEVNIAHNYAAPETHFGKEVMVHRKGATRASKGEIGIIPGSQGTKSYIVKGLGNPLSFNSCSHGAGRKMGRKQAINTLVLEDEQKRLNDLGIVHSVRNVNDLDEAPGAYKDIDSVMAYQTDLVEVLVELRPLGVIKG